jgi:hypothetical protein
MLLKIYCTAQGSDTLSHGPSLVIAADHARTLPRPAAGKTWRYVATISSGDQLIAPHRAMIEAALASHGFFISRWALGAEPKAPPRPPPLRLRSARAHTSDKGRGQRAGPAFPLPA